MAPLIRASSDFTIHVGKESEMDKETAFALRNLLDIVERLTKMAEEANPGAGEDVRFIRFLIDRVDRNLRRHPAL